jgi:hypothetical protein
MYDDADLQAIEDIRATRAGRQSEFDMAIKEGVRIGGDEQPRRNTALLRDEALMTRLAETRRQYAEKKARIEAKNLKIQRLAIALMVGSVLLFGTLVILHELGKI